MKILIKISSLLDFKFKEPIDHVFHDVGWSNNFAAFKDKVFNDKIKLCRRIVSENRGARVTVVFNDGRPDFKRMLSVANAKEFLKHYDPKR